MKLNLCVRSRKATCNCMRGWAQIRADAAAPPLHDGQESCDRCNGGVTDRLDIGADELGARNFFVLVLPDSQAYDMLYLPTVQR